MCRNFRFFAVFPRATGKTPNSAHTFAHLPVDHAVQDKRNKLSTMIAPLATVSQIPRRIRIWMVRRAHALQFDHHTHRGALLRIHTAAPDGALALLQKAVDLIADIDPVSHRNIPVYLPGGIAAEATSYASAWYNHPTRTCFIGARTIDTASVIDTALCIVHEMCHARLFARGIGYEEDLRLRVERVCIRRELHFARKLAAKGLDVHDLIAAIEVEVETFQPEQVSNSALRQSHRKQFLQRLRLLKRLDLPHWLRRFLILRARRKITAWRARPKQNT